MTPNDDFIARNEYESRHTEIGNRMTTIETKLDQLNDQLKNARIAGWRLLAISLLNFIAGGGLVTVFLYIVHVPK